jgi:hypothetical protein
VQFLGMGLIAEIVVRTYFESRQKSSYLVAEMMGFEQADRAVDGKPHPELTYVAKAPPRIPERLS